MKNIYVIGGTMGVGKTTTCQLLKKKMDSSVFLDGDWCWDANPFQVTEETKCMVLDNICYLLNNFIQCTAYKNIIFCWVMHEQSIINSILERLDTQACNVKVISLVCNEDCLRERLEGDIIAGIRSEDLVDRSIKRILLYEELDTIKINTTHRSVLNVVNEILSL